MKYRIPDITGELPRHETLRYPVGTLYTRADGGAGTTLYVKKPARVIPAGLQNN